MSLPADRGLPSASICSCQMDGLGGRTKTADFTMSIMQSMRHSGIRLQVIVSHVKETAELAKLLLFRPSRVLRIEMEQKCAALIFADCLVHALTRRRDLAVC